MALGWRRGKKGALHGCHERRNVVAPMGHWRVFTRSQATVNAVNSGEYADLGRAPTFSDNLVEVSLANGR